MVIQVNGGKSVILHDRFSKGEASCLGPAERQDMAGLEECEGKLLLTLYRLKQMKEENPWIRDKLEVLEKNIEDELLRLGWAMEQDVVADCDDEEEVVMFEDVADMTMMEEELEIDQVGRGSCSLQTLVDEDTQMEETHGEVSIPIATCVSLELLEDGPYARKGKVIL